MIITLLKKEKIYTLYLPTVVKGQFWVSDKEKNGQLRKLLSVEGVSDKWHIRSYRSIRITDTSGNDVKFAELIPSSFYKVSFGDTNETALIFGQEITSGRFNFKKYLINSTEQTDITIGRNSDNTIVYGNKFVSGNHCTITYSMDRWIIQDNKSGNGTFVNSYAVSSAELKPGDSVYVLGLTIIIGKDFIAINDPDDNIKLSSDIFKPYQPETIDISEYENLEEDQYQEVDYFYRSPRFKRELEEANFSVDAPPQTLIEEEIPTILVVGPAITMAIMALTMGSFAAINAMSTGNMMMAIPAMFMSVMMLVGTILWPTLSRRFQKKKQIKKEAERQEKYRAYLGEIEKQINQERKKQEEILNENFISVAECVNRVANTDISLWERGTDQNDILRLRVGIGDQDMSAIFNTPAQSFSLDQDVLKEELIEFINQPKKLRDVPVTISFFDNYFTSVIGNRKQCLDFANGLIVQLTALYGYDDVKTVFIYDEIEKPDLEYTKWLPHAWNNDESLRLIATNIGEVNEVSAFLEKEIEALKESDNEKVKKAVPNYVIFAFSRELALRAEVIKQLYAHEERINISVLSFFDELKNVPKECTAVIELEGTKGRIFDKQDARGKSMDFINDVSFTGDMVEYSTNLANIKLDVSATSYQLPKMVTFLEMFGVNKVEHLNASVRWKENDPTKSLKAPIGVNTLGDLFYLDLHEKFHGPHGLVAGMTGSGKSEVIITYILSLALNYNPDEVAFILIDYKGGGMAKAFENLPHVAGIITNLDGSAIKRSLVSIESELKRRQAFFTKASKLIGVSNIDIYKYQKSYRDGLVDEPLPHLFIISDEFAELKTQQPEFMTQLVSAARIGRSLGVHLILATQKPSGVVDDQIWSNSKFKVCLKVQDRSDSMEMLKRSDAAELVDTGRFYLQVGYNELFEIGQSSWAGADYIPDDAEVKSNPCSISVIDINGNVIQSVKHEVKKKQESNPKKQLDVITGYISQTAQDENAKARQLWLPPIEATVLLQDLHKKYQIEKLKPYKLNPLVGELDDPVNQRRLPFTMPISAEGNTIIYGMPGSGKEMLLTTMIYDLLQTHSAETLNVYAMDFGAETLKVFDKAPQFGGVALSTESEKISSLLKMIRRELKNRKKQFSDWGGDFSSYCERSGEVAPNIVVIINNYSIFTETYPEHEEQIASLTQECAKYGVYFIVTATSVNGVRYRTSQNFNQVFTLQLNDELDYSAVVGRTDGLFPAKFKGRGLIKLDEVHEFQVADIAGNADAVEEINKLCLQLKEMSNVKYVKRIPMLPEIVNPEFYNNTEVTVDRIPIGIAKSKLSSEYLQLSSNFITMVAANDVDKTIPFLQGMAEMLSINAGVDTVVLDVNNLFISDEGRKYEYFNQNLEDAVISLFRLIKERDNAFTNDGITDFEQKVYIIPSLQALYKVLSEGAVDRLNATLEFGSAKYGFNIIIGDRQTEFSSCSTQGWYKEHGNGNGIWIGEDAARQYVFNISKPTDELYDIVGDNYGVAINGGRFKVIKLLQSNLAVNEEGDEDE